ncbi:MAG: DUF6887 family protein [Pseudanabaena sp.]
MKVDYDSMSRAELKQYFLKHRGDRNAFQAYLARLNQRSLRVVASPNDPDFEQKVQAAIRERLESQAKISLEMKDKV